MRLINNKPLLGIAALAGLVSAQTPEAEVPILARTGEVDSQRTSVVYQPNAPLLVGNDGGAATGGFHIYELTGSSPLPDIRQRTPGRTKLVTVAHGVAGKDLIVTIAQTDSVFRVYDAMTAEQIGGTAALALGDWSALCSWLSPDSGETYVYLFGKVSFGRRPLVRAGC